MSIGRRLNQWRKDNNLKTTDIRDKIGISVGALSNYENDKREISSSFLLKIKEIYNADIYYILTGVKLCELADDEKRLLDCYKCLPENEKNNFLGRIQEISERYEKELKKSSSLRNGREEKENENRKLI